MKTRSSPDVALSLALALCIVGGCALSNARVLDDPGGPEIASSGSLAIDGTSLYWADPGRGAIFSAPRGGGPERMLAPADPSLYAPLAVTESDVVWVDQGEGIEVFRVALGGGERVLVGQGVNGPIGVAADARHGYFSRGPGAIDLLEVALDSGAERLVATDAPALGLRLDGDDLVGTSCGPDGVWRVSRDGARRSVIVAGSFCPVTLALDATHVYFSDYAEPTRPGVGGIGIFRAPRAGGTAARVALSSSLTFAVHRGAMYVAYEGAILAVSVDGATTLEVAPAASDVRGIAVDDDFVYWTEAAEDGAVELALAPRP